MISEDALPRRAPTHVASASSASDLYWDAFRAVPIVSFLTDDRAVILDANFAASNFLNVAAGALVRRPLLHFVARKDTQSFRTQTQRMSGDTLGPLVIRLRPRHGKPCAMRLHAARIHSRDRFVWIALPDRPT
jgi:PAS domain-containing protein